MSKLSLKDRFNKKNVISGFLVSAALSLTVFFFSPVDIFISDQIDFIVGYKVIVFPMLLLTLASTAAMMILLMLCLLIKETVYNVVKHLFFGVLCAMYIQMMFYNGKMTALTGIGRKYTDMPVYNYINYFVFFFISCLPFTLWGLKQAAPENKLLKKISDKTVPFVALSLTVMQLIGSVSMVFSYGIREDSISANSNNSSTMKTEGIFKKQDVSGAGYLSYEEAMKLSKDKNIVVFLTDRLDSIWVDETLEEYPELKDMLDGFTFYRDNVGVYTNTFPSVSQMLTGREYQGERCEEFLSEAWKDHNIMDELYDDGYRMNLLIDALTTYNTYRDISDIAATYQVETDYRINYMGYEGIVPTMCMFSMMKLGPYFLKGYFSERLNPGFANSFFIFKNENPAMMKGAVNNSADLSFYNYLQKYKLNTTSDKKTFNFIHLNFSHDPSYELAVLNPDFDIAKLHPNNVSDHTVDVITSTRGSFEILKEYFNQMKALGIYDSSTIIILGDHGRPPDAVELGADQIEDVILTGLLIKEANSEHAPLKINNTAQMTNKYFGASILEYAGLKHDSYGYSYNDVIRDNIKNDRYLQVYTYNGVTPLHVCQYTIKGDSHNFDNWEYLKINDN